LNLFKIKYNFLNTCEEINPRHDLIAPIKILKRRDMTCHDLIAPIKILTECSGERENKTIVSSFVLVVFL
jgi:hypothetical protein